MEDLFFHCYHVLLSRLWINFPRVRVCRVVYELRGCQPTYKYNSGWRKLVVYWYILVPFVWHFVYPLSPNSILHQDTKVQQDLNRLSHFPS